VSGTVAMAAPEESPGRRVWQGRQSGAGNLLAMRYVDPGRAHV
jgi:hypothetical protein